MVNINVEWCHVLRCILKQQYSEYYLLVFMISYYYYSQKENRREDNDTKVFIQIKSMSFLSLIISLCILVHRNVFWCGISTDIYFSGEEWPSGYDCTSMSIRSCVRKGKQDVFSWFWPRQIINTCSTHGVRQFQFIKQHRETPFWVSVSL